MYSRLHLVVGTFIVLVGVVSAIPARAEDSAMPVQRTLVEKVHFGPVVETPSFTTNLFESTPAFAATLQNQNNNRDEMEGFGVGAKVGPTFSTLTGDIHEDLSNKTGFMGGIWFGGNRGGVVGVEGELMYIVKGAQDSTGHDELKLHYLEIPILLRINIGSQSRNGFLVYVLGGPSANVLLKGELNGVDVKDQYEGFDIDAIGGVGVEITRILFEIRGDWGLRNVNKGNLGDTTKIHSRTIEALVGLRFN